MAFSTLVVRTLASMTSSCVKTAFRSSLTVGGLAAGLLMPAGHEHHERVRRSVDGVYGNAGSFMPPFRPRHSGSNERSRITRPYDASSSWRNPGRIHAAGGRGRRTQ